MVVHSLACESWVVDKNTLRGELDRMEILQGGRMICCYRTSLKGSGSKITFRFRWESELTLAGGKSGQCFTLDSFFVVTIPLSCC